MGHANKQACVSCNNSEMLNKRNLCILENSTPWCRKSTFSQQVLSSESTAAWVFEWYKLTSWDVYISLYISVNFVENKQDPQRFFLYSAAVNVPRSEIQTRRRGFEMKLLNGSPGSHIRVLAKCQDRYSWDLRVLWLVEMVYNKFS